MNPKDFPLSGMSHIRRYVAFCSYRKCIVCEVCERKFDSIKDMVVLPRNGDEYDLSQHNIQVVCRACGRKIVLNRRNADVPHEKIKGLYLGGRTMMQISTELNVSYGAVRTSLHNADGVVIRPRGASTIEESELEEIFIDFEAGQIRARNAAKLAQMSESTFYRRYGVWKRSRR